MRLPACRLSLQQLQIVLQAPEQDVEAGPRLPAQQGIERFELDGQRDDRRFACRFVSGPRRSHSSPSTRSSCAGSSLQPRMRNSDAPGRGRRSGLPRAVFAGRSPRVMA